MTALELSCRVFAWLVALAPITNGAPISRPIAIVAAIANAVAASCLERGRCDVAKRAAILDVWAAFETGYADVGGACPGTPTGTPCTKAKAITCGPWMTDCGRRRRSADLEGEAGLALDMFDESADACPRFPFGFYVAGGANYCRHFSVVDFRLSWVAKELGQ